MAHVVNCVRKRELLHINKVYRQTLLHLNIIYPQTLLYLNYKKALNHSLDRVLFVDFDFCGVYGEKQTFGDGKRIVKYCRYVAVKAMHADKPLDRKSVV